MECSHCEKRVGGFHLYCLLAMVRPLFFQSKIKGEIDYIRKYAKIHFSKFKLTKTEGCGLSGFTEWVKETADSEKVKLLTLEDLYDIEQ